MLFLLKFTPQSSSLQLKIEVPAVRSANKSQRMGIGLTDTFPDFCSSTFFIIAEKKKEKKCSRLIVVLLLFVKK